jgi:hypothetical protein
MAALAAAMLWAGAAAAEGEAGAMVSAGRLMIWGDVQFMYQQAQADPGRQVQGIQQFQTRHAQVGFAGRPSERVDYNITLEMIEGDTIQPMVYEVWVDTHLSRSLTLRAGSFRPPWTLTMARPVHDLLFIRYPLIVDSGQELFTPWRQTGLELSGRPGEQFSVSIGLFNGLDIPNNFIDDNNMKDTMISAGFEAYPGIKIFVGHWGGKVKLQSQIIDPGETAVLPFGLTQTNTGTAAVKVGGGLVEHASTWAAFELDRSNLYLAGEALWNRSTRDGSGLRNAQGYQFSAGYRFDRLMPLLRYEQFDPNTDNAGAGANDEMEWTTLGLNFDLARNARLMADYIFKVERAENQRANDEFIFQVSLGF